MKLHLKINLLNEYAFCELMPCPVTLQHAHFCVWSEVYTHPLMNTLHDYVLLTT